MMPTQYIVIVSLKMLSLICSSWSWLAAVAVYFLWRKSMKPFQFFVKRGVAFKAPFPIFGNFGKMITKQETMFDLIVNSYYEFKDKRFYGLYEFTKPLLTIRDPELIRQITVKDFEHFVDHRPIFPEKIVEPLLAKSLFVLNGQKWREMRATLSPAFTGSKMRQMFQLVVECSERSTAYLLREAKASRKPYVPEMKDLFTRFTNDVIATAAFGVAVDSQTNRQNEFYTMGKRATDFGSLPLLLTVIAQELMPTLSKLLGIQIFSNKLRQFYHSMVHETIERREREGIIRPDMIHLLMEARKGRLATSNSAAATTDDDAGFATVAEVRAATEQVNQAPQWDDDDLTAQCFLFLLAGFDTSSTLLCFAAHELMENPEVQQRLIAELDAARAELGGQALSYDVLQKLEYLDQVISETLRKWPPALAIDRQCQKAYQMTDETGHTVRLQPGDAVWIPLVAIHRDPKYWTEPDRFEPERFSESRKREIQPFTYLPFGSGPRNCIGSRFALMECKAFLFYLLTNFTFEVAQNSAIPLQLEASGFNLGAKNGFNVHLRPRF